MYRSNLVKNTENEDLKIDRKRASYLVKALEIRRTGKVYSVRFAVL